MRTTLNIDDDVAQQLAVLARAGGRSLSRVANDLMRDGLRSRASTPERDAYEPPVFDSGTPSIDVTDVAQALDRLDDRG